MILKKSKLRIFYFWKILNHLLSLKWLSVLCNVSKYLSFLSKVSLLFLHVSNYEISICVFIFKNFLVSSSFFVSYLSRPLQFHISKAYIILLSNFHFVLISYPCKVTKNYFQIYFQIKQSNYFNTVILFFSVKNKSTENYINVLYRIDCGAFGWNPSSI